MSPFEAHCLLEHPCFRAPGSILSAWPPRGWGNPIDFERDCVRVVGEMVCGHRGADFGCDRDGVQGVVEE